MLIKFKKGDPREGQVVNLSSASLAQSFIDRGVATLVEKEEKTPLKTKEEKTVISTKDDEDETDDPTGDDDSTEDDDTPSLKVPKTHRKKK